MKVIDSKIVDSGYEEFSKRPELDYNLAYAAVLGLGKDTSKHHIFDFSLHRKLDRATTLAVALALKEYIQKEFPNEERIGIALPSCFPGVAVNLAVQMAGKSSVNVNFTMGADAAKAAIERVNLNCIIGSNKVREKVSEHSPKYPWTDNFRDIGEILKKLGKKAIVPKLLMVKLLPPEALVKYYKIPTKGGDKEASIIFTSGSELAPKAAVLSHRNLMSNVLQCREIGIITEEDVLHANLPLFHSFGQTIQVWFTSVIGVRQVCVQSPLEVQANLKAIREGCSTIMISTPTFLRSYYKRATTADFPALTRVIAGAEKTPEGFDDAWNAKFPKSLYLEGYGLTETSPVDCVNLPLGLERNKKYCPAPSNNKKHSVGEMFPGMLAAIVDPESGEFLPLGETGLLYFKGPNVFRGYYNQPEENAKRFANGWLNTGDLAQIDEDGFIFIKGRLSRFSKIGGEMVPHHTVEMSIIKALGVQESDKHVIAIGSRPDDAKGEALVLLTTIDIDIKNLRQQLTEAGLPNLWIPKTCVKIEEIPILGSGKLDLGKIQNICKFS